MKWLMLVLCLILVSGCATYGVNRELSTKRICQWCHGTGRSFNVQNPTHQGSDFDKCRTCRGTGKLN